MHLRSRNDHHSVTSEPHNCSQQRIETDQSHRHLQTRADYSTSSLHAGIGSHYTQKQVLLNVMTVFTVPRRTGDYASRVLTHVPADPHLSYFRGGEITGFKTKSIYLGL